MSELPRFDKATEAIIEAEYLAMEKMIENGVFSYEDLPEAAKEDYERELARHNWIVKTIEAEQDD